MSYINRNFPVMRKTKKTGDIKDARHRCPQNGENFSLT